MTPSQGVYLDTSVFINIFTAGRHDPEYRLTRSEAVVTKSDMGEIQLVESTLVIAETLGAPNMRGNHIPKKLRYQALAQGRRFFPNAAAPFVGGSSIAASQSERVNSRPTINSRAAMQSTWRVPSKLDVPSSCLGIMIY